MPYALRPKVEEELKRLQNEGILTKVEWSDWATPIEPIPKKDGSVRICGDFKGTVNPELQAQQYPIPCIEDIFAKLAGGRNCQLNISLPIHCQSQWKTLGEKRGETLFWLRCMKCPLRDGYTTLILNSTPILPAKMRSHYNQAV